MVVGIGYEGLSLPEFLARVSALGVSHVVDVRYAARSRKPPFNKKALAAALSSVGVGYTHMPELGNPPSNRPGFGGSPAELVASRAVYAGLMPSLTPLVELASRERVALLCFEADQSRCHRDVILSSLP
ncbi:DUF488 domain-containing protein [Asanoa sp. NPDC050611]|uniref:DUF488 domain-containing protein n=1 Tax=Asanoa sp. NPDC050611 TaxID=3157098 RepID=UPI0033E96E21